ncbi:slipin family protein [Acidocella aromatica]|uniref:Regulator of protease activity HflC (Stomatin/prohibitin superfamily) n=1 Tax=Acidocella aromatica TaxID=1303579 RepID=A0A840VL75_9PROT|nr:slipin family protein [Acidocella aromatica]MBB5373905.1 regulator of protease activity HflC (stomatin/prohibitin superfamily) [Acidocella aromatica]
MNNNAVTLIAVFFAAIGAATIYFLGLTGIGIALIAVGIILGITLRTCAEWERAVVLFLGRFAGVRGPGLYFLIPAFENVYTVVDTRRQSTRISAEDTLTADAVSVTMDSILFWRVTDVKRAATELTDYRNMVAQVAQTSLREVISATRLSDLLASRELVDEKLQALIARKTDGWGIGDIAVEIRDVKIPPELNDAMSRNAQAEKEKEARVTLASAEVAIAEQIAAASHIYANNPVALQIRQMGLIYDMNKDRGVTILVPTGMANALGASIALNVPPAAQSPALPVMSPVPGSVPSA